MIGRRSFLLAAAAASPAFAALGQRRRPLLALLLTAGEASDGSNVWPAPLRRALAGLGWVEGRDIDIVSRFADNQPARLPGLAAELAALQPDIVLTHGSGGGRASAAFPVSTPIVIGAATEETLLALSGGSLARPQGNVTGLTIASREQHEKCLALLALVEPRPHRVGLLAGAENPAYRNWPGPLSGALTALGIEAVRFEASSHRDVSAAFDAMARQQIQAVLVTADPLFNGPAIDQILGDLALSRRLPLASVFDGVVRMGGLLSYGADYPTLVRRSASYIDRILRGARPSDLPIERPSVFRLTLNQKTANQLNLRLPTILLAQADEVIE
jgi:putative ABC transport system substrate-binding protein